MSTKLGMLVKPSDTVVAAVMKVCEYMQCTKTEPAKLKVPSLAIKLGYALRRCSTLWVNKALCENNTAVERDAESFVHIYDSRVSVTSIYCSEDNEIILTREINQT